MQACVAVEQNGVGPEQSVLAKQPTQFPPPATSHTERSVGQADLLVAVHWPHEPAGKHTGVVPPHSPSPAQPRQALLAPSQTGLLPGQPALLRQPTHASVLVSQTPFGDVQAPMLPAAHS
jgi:hypothetical protein